MKGSIAMLFRILITFFVFNSLVSVDAQDFNREESMELIRACSEGNVTLVKGSLQKKIDLNYFDGDGTALDFACKGGFFPIVKILLDAGAEVNPKMSFGEFRGKKSSNPLSLAIEGGYYEIAAYLLAHGAKPDIVNYRGMFPIHYVKDVKLLKLLISHGADINRYDRLKETLLYLTVTNSIGKGSVVIDTAFTNYILDSTDVNVDLQCINGNTSLHAAISSYNYALTTILLSKGANPNVQNDYLKTPIHIAIENFQYSRSEEAYGLIVLLVKHGSDLTISDNQGKSALELIPIVMEGYYYKNELLDIIEQSKYKNK